MSNAPVIVFKAGMCDVDSSQKPFKVTPKPERGYIFLCYEDELVKFCWRKRSATPQEADLELLMPPTDGSFIPVQPSSDSPAAAKPNGRVFVLKFASSPDRHFFWMQSKSQSTTGDASWFSPRDHKIGEVVNRVLQGEEVNVARELAQAGSPGNDDDDDEPMEDVDDSRNSNDNTGGGAGGAGADATGGDVRHEGESSREGGADGARAASAGLNIDPSEAVRNLLNSLRGNQNIGTAQQEQSEQQYPHLTHLVSPAATVPMVESATEAYLDSLLDLLPPTILILATGLNEDQFDSTKEPSTEAAEAAKAALSLSEKKELLKKVLHSPQFRQALASLTLALREGGLPDVAGALGIGLENGGRLRGGMPLGGGEAVKAFVEGVKKEAKEKR